MSEETRKPSSVSVTLLIFVIGALCALGGVTFKLVLDRMDKQEAAAESSIAQVREEIKITKEDAQAAVARQEAAATAAASVLRDSVASTAKAAKDGVDASAKALSDSVTATAKTAKDAVDASAANLEKLINGIDHRTEKLEDRAFTSLHDGAASTYPPQIK